MEILFIEIYLLAISTNVGVHFSNLKYFDFILVCVCMCVLSVCGGGVVVVLITFMIFTLFDDIFLGGGKGGMWLGCERKKFSLAHSDQIFKVV